MFRENLRWLGKRWAHEKKIIVASTQEHGAGMMWNKTVFLGLLNGEGQQGRITPWHPGWWSRPQETWLVGTACTAGGSDRSVKIRSTYYFVRYSTDVVTHNVMVVRGWRRWRTWQCCSLIWWEILVRAPINAELLRHRNSTPVSLLLLPVMHSSAGGDFRPCCAGAAGVLSRGIL